MRSGGVAQLETTSRIFFQLVWLCLGKMKITGRPWYVRYASRAGAEGPMYALYALSSAARASSVVSPYSLGDSSNISATLKSCLTASACIKAKLLSRKERWSPYQSTTNPDMPEFLGLFDLLPQGLRVLCGIADVHMRGISEPWLVNRQQFCWTAAVWRLCPLQDSGLLGLQPAASMAPIATRKSTTLEIR